MGRGNRYVVPANPDEDGSEGGSLTKKPSGSWSWMLMDSSGEESILEVDKYAIMNRVKIQARDLRILDPLLSYPSTIVGRERAIVLNLEHIKAIITAEEVLLRDPLEENVTPVLEELRRRLQPVHGRGEYKAKGQESFPHHDVEPADEAGEAFENQSPFEFRALEVALEAICSYLASRSVELESAVYPALDMLTSKISSFNLDRVRKLKSQMTRLTGRVQKVRDELEQLLDHDDNMAYLYLSRKLVGGSARMIVSGAGNQSVHSGRNRSFHSAAMGSKFSRASIGSFATIHGDENGVEELEMLLEAYFMQIDGTLNKLSTLREYISNTEDYINIQLDNHRNQLIQLELFLVSVTVSLSVYSLAGGIFGMNIPYIWNNGYGYVFTWVVVASGIFTLLFFIAILGYARYKGLLGSP